MKATNLTRQQSLAISRGLVAPTAARSFSWVEDMTNGEGADIPEGSVVVVVSDGTIELADTLNDPRPVGVALDTIDDGETGQVAFGGPVDKVLTTGSVTAGDFGQTSTTPGQAQTAPSGPTAFLEFTDTGTDPSAFLWGGRGGGGVGGGSGGGTPAWFDVTTFGATGDGTTDDTTAINAAIAALIAAGCGVLYFPCGTYKVTAGLTAITVPVLVLGDGGARNGAVSTIQCTSTTADLFTVTSDGAEFRDLFLENTSAGASAGSGINLAGGFASFIRCGFISFYDNVTIEDSAFWLMDNCYHGQATGCRYGVRVRNTALPDTGDWMIANSTFAPGPNCTAIRVESSGGGKIINCKINANDNAGTYAIDLALSSVVTSVLLVSNCSLENVKADAIRISTTGSGTFGRVVIDGNQFGLYANTAGAAVNVNASAAAAISGVVIANNEVYVTVNANAAFKLTNADLVRLSGNVVSGYTSHFSTAGTCTNIVDDSGAIAAGVNITGTPSSGQSPVASSGTAAAWATPASPAADYLVGTAQGSLSAEIVVGTTPGGELGNTWASPTVDTTHSGSSHADAIATAEAYTDAAIAALTTGGAHAHVASETHLSDGSTVTWTLDQVFEPGSVIAWNTTTLARLGVTEVPPDQATVSAAGTSGDSIVFDYAASIA